MDGAEVVRRPVDVCQAASRPVVPVQLNMDGLETVVSQAVFFV
jgi:hypothetical protein